MPRTSGKRPFADTVLIVLLVVLGVSALIPGAMFMLAPDGHLIQMPMSNLQDSPFRDYFIPGLLLFCFVGVFPVLVAYGLWRMPAWEWPNLINPFRVQHWSWAGSLAAGVILIIWITAQVFLIKSVAFLHYLYWGWGIVVVLLTLASSVRQFHEREAR
ncbi:MAG: hypothetical protein ACK2T0_05635 [Anaerolineales bacterium]